jgi:four helix bundle protein
MKDENSRDLRERTKDFALLIIRMYGALPKSSVAQILGKQIVRSGTSVGANYREAFRARSNAEFISKIGDCLKELDETSYWLELLTETFNTNTPQISFTALSDECNQLLAIFTTISKKAKNRTS